ncbi:transporter substrate-binding domain-containing protein [Robbsia sp. KACC 23696]|uniref:substrate-binding periplasmic protein n=1 Tax=Robbsia sp. KACC 23696 TaxID=3149231 RepID=UPI00325B02F8
MHRLLKPWSKSNLSGPRTRIATGVSKMLFTTTLGVGLAVASMMSAVTALAADTKVPASAAPAAGAESKPLLTFNDYPNPWPLRHLVKGGKITVAVTPDSPPASFRNPTTGEIDGWVPTMLRQFSKDIGVPIDFVVTDWASTLPGLAANRYDLGCAGAAWTKARLSSPDFLMSDPTDVTASAGLTLKDSGIATWTDTNGKKMGGIRGEIYFEDAKTKLPNTAPDKLAFPGNNEAIMALVNKQVDFVMFNLAGVQYALSKSPQAAKLKMISPTLTAFPEGMCINPREPDLLVAINVMMGNYRATGQLRQWTLDAAKTSDQVDLLKSLGY